MLSETVEIQLLLNRSILSCYLSLQLYALQRYTAVFATKEIMKVQHR